MMNNVVVVSGDGGPLSRGSSSPVFFLFIDASPAGEPPIHTDTALYKSPDSSVCCFISFTRQ